MILAHSDWPHDPNSWALADCPLALLAVLWEDAMLDGSDDAGALLDAWHERHSSPAAEAG